MTAKSLLDWGPTIVAIISIGIGIGVFQTQMQTIVDDVEEIKSNQVNTEVAALKIEVQHLKESNRKDDDEFKDEIKEVKALIKEDKDSYREQWRKFGQHMDSHAH